MLCNLCSLPVPFPSSPPPAQGTPGAVGTWRGPPAPFGAMLWVIHPLCPRHGDVTVPREQGAKFPEDVPGGRERAERGAGEAAGTYRLRATALIFPAGLPFPWVAISSSWQPLKRRGQAVRMPQRCLHPLKPPTSSCTLPPPTPRMATRWRAGKEEDATGGTWSHPEQPCPVSLCPHAATFTTHPTVGDFPPSCPTQLSSAHALQAGAGCGR